jgi:hypothetical protein
MRRAAFVRKGRRAACTLNLVPFVNATAGAHDYLFNANPGLSFDYFNVPTMLPAAVFGIAASLNDPAVAWWINYISNINGRKKCLAGEI